MEDCYVVGNSQLSRKEYSVLQQFKNIFCQHEDAVDTSEVYLLRWLKARDFKLDQAEKMLRDHLQWRKEYFNGKNLIHEKPPMICQEYYPDGIVGFDKEGCPVYVFRFGRIDIKGILQCISPQELRNYVVYMFDLLQRMCETQTMKHGKLMERIVCLLDMDGFSFGNFSSKQALDFTCGTVKLFDLNFPETLKCAVVVNAPRSFTFLWKILKPLISEKTSSKTHIFGNEGYKAFLATIIDDEALPSFLGGKLTDPDGNPFCVTMITPPQKVPESLKSNKMMSSSETQEIVLTEIDFPFKTELIVPRGLSKDIFVDVQQKQNCLLSWSFYASGQDINFEIVKEDSNEKAEIIEDILVEETRKKSSKLKPRNGQQVIEGGSTCYCYNLLVRMFVPSSGN